MKVFSMDDVRDGLFVEEDDVLIIPERDFKDKNLSLIIKQIIKFEPDIKKVIFNECLFNKVFFENETIDIELSFLRCSFYDEVLFKKCIFNKGFSFLGSVFHRKTIFDDCSYTDWEYNFNEIETKPTCEYFGILNTKIDPHFHKVAYTKLHFFKANFQSRVAFNELTDLCFGFVKTIFRNEFYFSNTRLGIKTIFDEVQYPIADIDIPKIELKKCFQVLLASLSNQPSLRFEGKLIEQRIEALDNTNGEVEKKKDVYTEKEMCDECYSLGPEQFRKLKTDVRRGKIELDLPKPCKRKPLLYHRSEVERFKTIWLEYNSQKKKKKKENQE